MTGGSWDVAIEMCATHLSNGSFPQQHEFDTATRFWCGSARVCHGECGAEISNLLNREGPKFEGRVYFGYVEGEVYDVTA